MYSFSITSSLSLCNTVSTLPSSKKRCMDGRMYEKWPDVCTAPDDELIN